MKLDSYQPREGGCLLLTRKKIMNKSESIIKIAPALLAAQKLIGAAKKDAKNPFFKSSYADLGSVMEVCKKPLNDNGLLILQPVGRDELGTYVETWIFHESGEFMSERTPVIVKAQNDPQALGSAITYSRRYGLQSFGFIPAEDDDGEHAMSRVSKPAVRVEDGITYEPVEDSVAPHPADTEKPKTEVIEVTCDVCGKPATERKGVTKAGKAYHGVFCSTDDKSHTRWLWN